LIYFDAEYVNVRQKQKKITDGITDVVLPHFSYQSGSVIRKALPQTLYFTFVNAKAHPRFFQSRNKNIFEAHPVVFESGFKAMERVKDLD